MLYKVMAVENKGFFYTTFRGKKIRHRNWIYEIECIIKSVIDERRVILEKFRKITIKFGLSMTEKYQLLILILD